MDRIKILYKFKQLFIIFFKKKIIETKKREIIT